ncbi:MAG: hypothetical protein AMJ91_00720 [candidate division Zixibacteria bacterium SM23_73_3]|nr:MAG: hypothetical protein AMJ91_00720 [candidate division Zixibacteria bacterium SM23_73_3]
MAKIEINLLPRELRGKRRGIAFDRGFTLMAAIAGILVVLFVGVNVLQSIKLKGLNDKIAEAQKRTDELRKNIELVDALTEVKDKVLQRISAIEMLDRNRAIWVRVLEDLSKRVPDYLWLSFLSEEESQNEATSDTNSDSIIISTRLEPPIKKVTIEGYSHSLNSLASFLIQLIRSQYFKNMELQYAKRTELKAYKGFSFQLVGDLYYLPEVESPVADTAIHELASENKKKDSKINLAVREK